MFDESRRQNRINRKKNRKQREDASSELGKPSSEPDKYSPKESEISNAEISDILYDYPDERVVSVLGRAYASSVLREGKVAKSVVIVSNKRVYQEGSQISDSTSGFTLEDSKEVISLRSVDACRTLKYANLRPASIASMVMFLVIFLLFYDNMTAALVLGFALAAVAFFFVKAIVATEHVQIVYNGEKLTLRSDWYDPGSIDTFIRELMKQRDKISGAGDS